MSMHPVNLFKSNRTKRGFSSVIATLGIGVMLGGELWAEAVTDTDDGGKGDAPLTDAIVSEKNEVELVEDSNVSEAIQRRPDLSFANITIDGEGSRQSLDTISAEAVSSVEILKAVTPDQDADSRGGSIRLKTRPSYTQKGTSTKIMLETDYNSYVDDIGYEGSISVGGPLNEARTIGGRITVGYETQHRGDQFINKDWFRRTVDGESKLALRDMSLSHTEEWNSDRDISAVLDLKVSESLRLSWKGSHSLFRNLEKRPQLEYRFNQGNYVSIDRNGGSIEGIEVERGYFEFENEYEVAETTFGADWTRGDWEADFRAVYQDDSYRPLDYFNIDFVNPDIDATYDLDSYLYPKVTIDNGTSIDDADLFVLEDVTYRDRRRAEIDTIGAANLKWNNAFGNDKLALRLGAKSRRRDNDTFNETSYYDDSAADRPFALTDVEWADNGISFFSNRYELGSAVDREASDAYIEANFDSFTFDERRSRERSDSSTYTVQEQVDALYAMGDYSKGKWRALVGVRQENTSIDFEANEVLLGKDALDKDSDGDFDEIVYLGSNPTFGSNEYNHLFPNTHLRYKLNDNMTFITSFTKTIDRPSYADVVPYRLVALEDREVEEGNPELNPTLYTNIDFSVDMRTRDGGLVSVELFDRQLDDYIFGNETTVVGGIYDGFELERQENSSSAFLRGVSMTWSQPIRLPLIEDGFSINAKYVKQESELQYPERPGEVLPLPRMPDNEMNLSFTYEKDKLFAQFKLWNEDDNVFRVGKNVESDRYAGSRSRVDLSVSYKLQKKSRFYVEWDNITNEPYFRIYEGSPLYATYYRTRPWSLTTGMRIEL